MSLELAPEVENTVREYAEAEGVSINDLIARTFPPRTARRDPAEHVRNLLSQWQQQDGTRFAQPAPNDGAMTPSEALFQKWVEEDEQMSEAERQLHAESWEKFKQDVNSERDAAGMRLIF